MGFLYSIFLPLHSIVRWIVVITALLALGRALAGLLGKRPWTELDRKAGVWFTMAMDTQVLIGLILYFFLSPITAMALQNFGGAMGNSDIRFFAVEHIVLMIVALGLAHVGTARIKKAQSDSARYRGAVLWFGLAVVVLLAAIPWPFMPVGRPWIRF